MKTYKLIEEDNVKKVKKILEKQKNLSSKYELLFEAIKFRKNKVAKYIINNEDIDFNYKYNYLDIVEVCILNNNIEILDLLKQKNVDLYREYDTKSGKVNNLDHIRDLEIFKYFENNIDKKILKQGLKTIIGCTIYSMNCELLDYIIKNYNIKLFELNDNLLVNIENLYTRTKESIKLLEIMR